MARENLEQRLSSVTPAMATTAVDAPPAPAPEPAGQAQYAEFAGYLKRPGLVNAAAALAFISAGTSALFATILLALNDASRSHSPDEVHRLKVVAVVMLVGAVLYVAGALIALTGRTFTVLYVAAGAAIVLHLIAMFSDGGFMSFVGMILPGAILALLLNGHSETWLASRHPE